MEAMARTPETRRKLKLLRLRALAAEQGLSVSEMACDEIDNLLTQVEQQTRTTKARRAIAAVGRFRSGGRDAARRHDEFLVSAYENRV